MYAEAFLLLLVVVTVVRIKPGRPLLQGQGGIKLAMGPIGCGQGIEDKGIVRKSGGLFCQGKGPGLVAQAGCFRSQKQLERLLSSPAFSGARAKASL